MTDIACVVQSQDSLGESVIWCPRTRKVWWLDILKPCLQSFDPASGAHQVYPLPGPNCGCAALRAAGGFVLAMDNGLHAFDPESGRLDFMFHPEPEPATNRYNDGRVDRRGRFWLGTMDCDIRGPTRQPLPARRRPLVAEISRRHQRAELDRVLAGRPHHVFRRYAAAHDLGVRFRHRGRHDLEPARVRGSHGAQRPAGRLLRRRRGLSLECRVRRQTPDALRAGRPRRSHRRTAGDEPDLLLLRRRHARHALCGELDAPAFGGAAQGRAVQRRTAGA